MKILWVKSDFLHPTTKGGHIRTLEMLKRLHVRHEIHYVALDLPEEQPGGVERSSEYCAQAYPVAHHAPRQGTARFWLQAAGSVFSELPLAVSRYRSSEMKRLIGELTRRERFDAVVCDFLFAAPNIPDLGGAVLFQHNVEAQIWKRRMEHVSRTPERLLLESEYRKMQRYEGEVCRAVKRVTAVSEIDAQTMRSEYGVANVQAVPTGVDVEYFKPPPQGAAAASAANLVFVGSMDWMPNVDGIRWFAREVLPRIRRSRPDCGLTIAGRRPDPAIRKLAVEDRSIRVTGTVADVRPYLWDSAISIVPLRIGGGTRLKIFEAMAARIPVVSTTIGAEGLDVRDGENIWIADTPEDFADRCVELLADGGARRAIADRAWEMVSTCYSWEVVSRKFEQLLT
jgi:sugar transferase (PEP-CTERM/EpsH1 system associated)